MIQLTDSPTGEDLYQELRAAAARQGVSLHRLGALLFPNGPGWKLEQMRIAKSPKPLTVERVRAIIAGEMPSLPETVTRQAREAAGMPPSRRQLNEQGVFERQQMARERLEQRIAASRRAHELRRPGEPLHAAARRIEQETRA